MVNYNRRMGNGVPTIMDYASPYINLAFTLKDREKEEENRELNKEQLKLENEWKAKQIEFQENANKIAMDTNTLNREKFEIEKNMNPDKPIDPILIQNLKAANDAKDKETGYAFLEAGYGDLISTLSEGAGKKPISASFADALGTLSATKDKRLKELAQLKEIAVSKKDQKAIQAADAMISDINNGDEKTLSKLFPGQYYNYKAGLAEKNQARLDKMAEKDVEGNKIKREAYLKTLTTEYDDLSKSMSKYRSGEKDLDGKPLIDVMSAGKIKRRMDAIKKEINSFGNQAAIGGNPQINASPQPTPRPSISGGVNQDVLLPENGAAISSTKESEPTTVRTQPPPIEEDIMVINRFASIAAEKGADLKNLDAFDKIVKDAKKRHKDNPEAVKSIDQTIELAKVGISETDVSSIMRMYGVDRPTAIAILKNQKEIKSAVGKVIKSGIDKGVSAISKGAEKGIDFLSKSNSYNAF